MRPTPLCPSLLWEGSLPNENVSIYFHCSLPLPIVHNHRCGFALIIVGRIFLVLSTDNLFVFRPINAILYGMVKLLTKNSWLEKSIDIPRRRIFDLLKLIELTSVRIESYKFECRRSIAFEWCVYFCQRTSTAKACHTTNQMDSTWLHGHPSVRCS